MFHLMLLSTICLNWYMYIFCLCSLFRFHFIWLIDTASYQLKSKIFEITRPRPRPRLHHWARIEFWGVLNVKMKNQHGTMKTMKTHLEPWKNMKKPTWTNWPPLIQKRDVTNTEPQLTYFDPKTWRYWHGSPITSFDPKTWRYQHRVPTDLLDV